MTKIQTTRPMVLLLCCALLVLAACGDKKKKDGEDAAVSGQVIAKVGGKEVTIHELDAERRAVGNNVDPNDDSVTRQILKAIVERKLLVSKAIAAEIDRQPTILLSIRRGREVALAQAYVQHELANRPAVSRTDIDKYIVDHPLLFSGRQIFLCDELAIMASDATPALLDATKSAKKIDDVAKVMDDKKVQYHRPYALLSTGDIPPELVTQLSNAKPDDILLIKTAGASIFVKVLGARPDPVNGDQAVELARRILQTKLNTERIKEVEESALVGADVSYEGPFVKLMAEAPKTDAKPDAATTTPAPEPAK